jgi:peptidyl-prolyl cis-trans isomerase SurA
MYIFYNNRMTNNLSMAKRLFLFLAMAACLPFVAWAQQEEDPVLFTVEGTPIHVSEFTYIYSKTNGKRSTFSRASLEEYLDLYVKFKLKVQKAKEMQLDTIPQLKTELEGYRRQLADSYLIDKEVTDKLIKEAYEHSKEDVDISHILVMVKQGAAAEDELAAYEKVKELKEQLEGGADFATLARQHSDDGSAKNNGGHIGYATALFPKGFYELEKAAYSAETGTLQGPIRTDAGYHLLMVHDRRPARGEIEAAHILLRTGDNKDNEAVKARIDSLYQLLESGADFEELAVAMSEDKNSAAKGGRIGFFGINTYSTDFEDAAFALESDGDFTKPVQTSVGWHIIQRISKRDIQPYNIEKGRLENEVKKDPRFEQAKAAMVERIKKDANLKQYPEVLESFTQTLSDTFLTFRWKAPEDKSEALLLEFGEDYPVTLGDFTDFLGRSSRKRIRMGRSKDLNEAVQELYTDFINETAMRYEEKQLEKKYPDFRALMREYEEGILLFEATKMLVWDKAAQDSVGLENFYEEVKGKYRWPERAETSIYRVDEKLKDQLDEFRDFTKTHTPAEVSDKYNTGEFPMVRYESKTFQKKLYPEFKQMKWKEGALSKNEYDPRAKVYQIVKIEELLEPRIKTLDEARGYVVADYQDYLEDQWVESLRKEYKVKVNEDVFEELVQEEK